MALTGLVAVAFLARCGSTHVASVPPRKDAFVDWMYSHCRAGETGDPRRDLERDAARLEPKFLAALRDGPPRALVEGTRQSALREFEAGRNFLLSGDFDDVFDPSDPCQRIRQHALRLRPDSYVTTRIACLEEVWIDDALRALAIIGTGTTISQLERMVAQMPEKNRPQARRTMRTIRQRLGHRG